MEKSFGYTLLLGVCMIISLLLIGKMLLYHPAPLHTPGVPQGVTTPEETEKEAESGKETMRFSEEEVARMIEARLPADFPAKGIAVSISQDGTVSAQGTVVKDKLTGYVEGGMLRSALTLLPAEFALEAGFTAESGQQDTPLVLSMQSLAAGGFSLSVSALSSALTDGLNRAVNEAIRESCPGCVSVRLEDGALALQSANGG